MITKEQLIASMRHETESIKHLATKVPAGALDYRPTRPQRSLLELMQYMTRMAAVPTSFAVHGTWDAAEALEAETKSVTPETFATEMDNQMDLIEGLLAGVDEEEARTRPSSMPWGAPTTQGAGLMDMPLKCLVAYRMQFFLYLKAAGVADIGSANCWAGMDMPALQAVPASRETS